MQAASSMHHLTWLLTLVLLQLVFYLPSQLALRLLWFSPSGLLRPRLLVPNPLKDHRPRLQLRQLRHGSWQQELCP